MSADAKYICTIEEMNIIRKFPVFDVSLSCMYLLLPKKAQMQIFIQATPTCLLKHRITEFQTNSIFLIPVLLHRQKKRFYS